MLKEIKKKWKSIDLIVHAIAFSNREELKGKYLNTSKENFKKTLDVSCYSFTSVAREASKIMNNGGSLLTLSYFGSEKFMPHYNVMGIAKSALEASIKYLAKDLGEKKIRVNALSPGPIKTLAASAIGDFNYILNHQCYILTVMYYICVSRIISSLIMDMNRYHRSNTFGIYVLMMKFHF